MTTSSQPADPLLARSAGASALCLGNEAIVRGAIEAGVGFAAGYPGTPSSEITDAFARLAPELGIGFEYSVNEKIALEMAFAASLARTRSICAMKHLGLMYAGDPLSTMPYIGTVAGMVIVSAADPGCLTSPNEQDQRWLGPMLHIPVLEPHGPQHALELTRFAFELGEACNLPILLRPTTRVCHTRGLVQFGERGERRTPRFDRDPARFNPIPANARRMRGEIFERLARARALIEEHGCLAIRGEGSTAILAAGAPAATASALLDDAGLADELAFWTLSAQHPLPEESLVRALRGVGRVLVVEELSPFLETAVRLLVVRHGLDVEILGKESGHLPVTFEYEPEVIAEGLEKALGLRTLPARATAGAPAEAVVPRPPILCSSCPHRSAYFATRAALGDDALYFNDIGCYTLGYGPPLDSSDALLSMGAGFTLAAGVSRVTGERTVGFMGDSTFFHSGMPALLNAIKEKVDMVAVILDNEVTAMTGFQESPGIHPQIDPVGRDVKIADVVRALGAEHVKVVDPNDLADTVLSLKEAKDAPGLSVVIAERACPVYLEKATGEKSELVFTIDQDLCQHCGRDAEGTRCGQGISLPFERQMAKARSLEVEQDKKAAVATCAEACPLNLCVQGYAMHVAAGEYADALELIMERLPLPDSVCRVCDRPCETSCVRAALDEPVAINDLKRFVMDWAAAQPTFPYRYEPEARHGKRVAVVGAGPSGLACAQECALRGYEVALFDAAEAPGGLLRSGIPKYRLPAAALERDCARVLELGVAFEGGRRLGANLELATLLAEHDAVYLAIGAGRGLALDLGGEAPPVVDALAFLRAQSEGDCARVDGPVLVIGGGNAAIDAARSALRRGAESVTLACLEAREDMPAIAQEVREAEAEGVALLCGRMATGASRDAVALARVERGAGAGSVLGYAPIAGSEAEQPASLVICAIGQVPVRVALAGVDLAWTEDGLLEVERETGATACPGLFAGGDLVPGARTVTGALGQGQRAAWAIDRALRGAEAADARMPPPIPVTRPGASRPGVTRADPGKRRHPPELTGPARTQGFGEVVGVLSEVEARAEASRCMVCGLCGNCNTCIDTFGCPAFFREGPQIRIDASLCTGCAVCADLCPNGAIHGEKRA